MSDMKADPDDPHVDPSYIKFVNECAKDCQCCPECQDHPCDPVMAGGLCDRFGCMCYEDADDDLGVEDDCHE